MIYKEGIRRYRRTTNLRLVHEVVSSTLIKRNRRVLLAKELDVSLQKKKEKN